MYSQNKGKIALISVHGDPSIEIGKEEAGGQNVYVRQVGEALGRLGWQVDMFTRKIHPEQANIVEHTSNCRTIRLSAGPEKFIERDRLFDHLPEFVKSFLNFQGQTQTLYPLIHTNYWLSAWVGLELHKHHLFRQIHTYHSLGAVKYRSVTTIPLIANTRLSVEKTCLETADCIVATSPQEQEDMRSLVSSQGNITVIPCGTNVQHFASTERHSAREKLGFAPDAKVILYVGRFDPRKGIETLVRAVGRSEVRHPENLKLIIVGGSRPGHKDGRERDRIESIVKELGLEEITIFPGQISQSELPNYYAAADVCVIPSHYEPFGLVAIEAMASGIPVIASDVGGLKYTVVSQETGLLVEPKNEVAFADGINQILSDPSWAKTLGKAGQKRVLSYFSWDGVAEQLDQLYLSQLKQLHQDFFAVNVVS
ncbi:glycosyl transferase group 1 [Gloeothece citriformis PCC 7424]|uniref:Glycosyl transferase group 1 n=1 Tax=Gloeothece citriformis (strain PCC 7424) TaxID=65393 RepID=B7KDR4_GLOC7|nr:glycosyltransferase family 1 protein [Gloeothece citriformis]ACK70366.1 glycosyl transferase group 1 [Gloeothece citriformis PCC 7424]